MHVNQIKYRERKYGDIEIEIETAEEKEWYIISSVLNIVKPIKITIIDYALILHVDHFPAPTIVISQYPNITINIPKEYAHLARKILNHFKAIEYDEEEADEKTRWGE